MFGLTPDERRVILFFAIVALVGAGANFLIKKCPLAKAAISLYRQAGKVDLNTADRELLMGVPGIGEKLARRIIEYRAEAQFQNTEELKKIKGITNYRYEKVKDYLTVK